MKNVDPLLIDVLGVNEVSEKQSPPTRDVIEDLIFENKYGVKPLQAAAAPAQVKTPASIEEIEQSLAALRKQSGMDFRRLLGEHASGLRSAVRDSVRANRTEILALVSDGAE